MLDALPLLLFWIAGVGATVVALTVTWWALFGDRARGRRRCPRCWHDLSGTRGLTCNECGYTARDERAFGRTRRRYRVALVTLTLLFAGAMTVRWSVQNLGWESLVPDRIMVAALPWMPGDGGVVRDELSRRLFRGELSAKAEATLFNQCVEGQPGAPPSTPQWQARYVELLDWWRRSGMATPEQRERLLALPVNVSFTPPAVAIAGFPPHLEVRVETFWPDDADCRITITPRIDGASPLRLVRGLPRWTSPPHPLLLPPLPAGRVEVPIDVVLERRERITPADPESGKTAWSVVDTRTIDVTLTVEACAADELLLPVDDARLRALLEEVFSDGLTRWTEGEFRYGIRFNPRATAVPGAEGVAFGVRVEILERDEVRRASRLWWMGGSAFRRAMWEITDEDRAALDRATTGGEWTMRIVGDRSLALRALPTAPGVEDGAPMSCWVGEIVIPLELHVREGRSPQREWRADREGDGEGES